jgi:predicted phosphodiesterase
MKIICITDIHANLPALQATLEAIRGEDYDALFHTGDAIGIGPFPAESLDLMLNIPRSHFVMGNHDAYFVDGLTKEQTAGMGEGELEHQCWTHDQLNKGFHDAISQWPYSIFEDFGNVRAAFVHYGLRASGRDYMPIVKNPAPADLDQLFQRFNADLVFYGHHHPFSDVQGRARYINPGSLGCFTEPLARYTVVEMEPGSITVAHKFVSYDDDLLRNAFQERNVPVASFIAQAFFGGRFRM